MDAVAFARILGVESTVREQHGVIRRDQALAAGVTRIRFDALVRQGRWVRVLPRVYAVGLDDAAAGPPRGSWLRLAPRARIHACQLWAGDDAIIAGEAAAWWHGLCREPPAIVTVIIPPNRRLTPQPGIRVIRARVERRDIREDGWVRVTAPSRTCLDLARTAAPDRLEDALRLRKVDQPAIERSLERGRGRRGQLRARKAAEAVATDPWSSGERVAHRALTEAGVTGWVANPPVRLSIGVRYPDVAFEDIKLAVEIDGRRHHGTATAFERDRVRHNAFVQAGWVVLHFTHNAVLRDPQAFVTVVAGTAARLRVRTGDAD